MADAPIIDLVLRLWPAARDDSVVADPADLDLLLATQGGPGAPGRDCGLLHTFACFGPDRDAAIELPTGERTSSDAEARFVGHLLVTRLMLAAGLAIDERITHAAGGTAGTGMARQRLERLITEAGRVPVLRDTLYRPIQETSVVA